MKIIFVVLLVCGMASLGFMLWNMAHNRWNMVAVNAVGVVSMVAVLIMRRRMNR